MPSFEQKAKEFAQLRFVLNYLNTIELTKDICEVNGRQDIVYCCEQFDMLFCAYFSEMKL